MSEFRPFGLCTPIDPRTYLCRSLDDRGSSATGQHNWKPQRPCRSSSALRRTRSCTPCQYACRQAPELGQGTRRNKILEALQKRCRPGRNYCAQDPSTIGSSHSCRTWSSVRSTPRPSARPAADYRCELWPGCRWRRKTQHLLIPRPNIH